MLLTLSSHRGNLKQPSVAFAPPFGKVGTAHSLFSTQCKLTLEWRKWPLTPSRMTVPSRRVTPMPSKRREMRGRMLEKALKARLLPEAPVMPSRGATSRRSLSLAPCFFRSRS